MRLAEHRREIRTVHASLCEQAYYERLDEAANGGGGPGTEADAGQVKAPREPAAAATITGGTATPAEKPAGQGEDPDTNPARDDSDSQTFAEFLRTRRVELGWSQAMMGGVLGVDQTKVSKWERGIGGPVDEAEAVRKVLAIRPHQEPVPETKEAQARETREAAARPTVDRVVSPVDEPIVMDVPKPPEPLKVTRMPRLVMPAAPPPLGDRLKEWREARGLTTEEAAKILGMRYTHLLTAEATPLTGDAERARVWAAAAAWDKENPGRQP